MNTPNLLYIHIIEVVLDKLHTCSKVSLVELIGDVPAKGPKLTPLLHSGVQEGHGVEHGPPLG